MTNVADQAWKHLYQLCVAIGPRPIGSTENLEATHYIQDHIQKNGLQVEEQTFDCPIWDHQGTHLLLDGEELRVGANGFSPSCDVTRTAVSFGTLSTLEQADLKDHIAILYGDLTKGTGYPTRGAIYYPEQELKVIQLLEEKAPAALILVHSKIGSSERLMRDWSFQIPSVSVPLEVGLRLLNHPEGVIHLSVQASLTPGKVRNLIATLPGEKPERLILCAHFDSVVDCPGAVDNGAGTAALLALAEVFASRWLPLTLEFAALNGEENGGLGDVVYLSQRGDSLGNALAVINMDGIGNHASVNSITMLGESQPFHDLVCGLHQKYPGMAWVAPWRESDHYAFFSRGVPAVAFSSVSVDRIVHNSTDTVEWVSPARLGEVVAMVSEILEALQDKNPGWTRKPVG